VDEVGFSMTASNTYSWSPVGQRLYVPYEAPQGRRVNAIGALFHHSQRFEFLTRAKAPRCKKKPIPKAAEGLEATELGTLDAAVVITFFWQIAGRPDEAPKDWRRDKPLVIVLDNYSVHKSKEVKDERLKFQAADVDLFFLPSYSPELSAIEPVWHDVKQHRMRRRSRDILVDLKRHVDAILTEKASSLTMTQNRQIIT
jgi:hypothetical protein